MIMLKPEARFFSVGSTLGATLAFGFAWAFPKFSPFLFVLYLMLFLVGANKLKDEIKEVFR